MVKKIWLGAALLLVILTASFYMLMPGKVRIDFTKTRTIFTVYNPDTEKFDDVQGIEYTRIFDGTTLMRAKAREISYEIKAKTTEWYRIAKFKENITVEDFVYFDNEATDVEQVPVSHKACFTNAKGKIFEYLISDIEYNGITKSITSPFSFGKNMKVTFQDGYHIAKVVNNKVAKDKIVVRYRIEDGYECFDVRLFDPIPEFTVGSNYTFSSAAIQYTSVTFLNSSHFVVVYQLPSDSNHGKAIIGTISNDNEITYGSEYEFNAGSSAYIDSTRLNDTDFVVRWRDDSNFAKAKTIIGRVSNEDEIAFGSEKDFSIQAVTGYGELATIDETHFLSCFAYDGLEAVCAVGNVSGLVITNNSNYVYNPSSTQWSDVVMIDSTHFAIGYRNVSGGGDGVATIGTISDLSTITYGEDYVVNSGSTFFQALTTLDDTHFVFSYRDDGDGYKTKAKIGVISNEDEIAFGSAYTFEETTMYSQHTTLTTIDSTQFIIAYHDDGTDEGLSLIGEVSNGNEIAYGNKVVFSSSNTKFNDIDINGKSFVIAYEDDGVSDYGQAVIGTLPPTITILSPIEDTVYGSDSVDLNWTVDTTPETCSYSLDGESNVSFVNCYQETANDSSITSTNPTLADGNCNQVYNGSYYATSSGGNGYFYVNYTKPAGALSSSVWMVKHGNVSSPIKNWTIPPSCWNQNPLQFQIYTLHSGSAYSETFCHNGTDWETIELMGVYYNSPSLTISTNRVADGDWDTETIIMNSDFQRLQSGDVQSIIWEEAMWWELEPVRNITLTGLSDGSHNVTVNCVDAVGGTGSSEYTDFIVDLSGPDITIVHPTEDAVYQTVDIDLNWTYTDFSDLDWCGYSLDGAANSTGICPPPPSVTITLKNETNETLDDAMIYENNADKNYGISTTLAIGAWGTENQRSYIKFNISSIPIGSTIDDSNLYLYASSSVADVGGVDIQFYGCSNTTWVQGTTVGGVCSDPADCGGGITYNRQPTNCNFVYQDGYTIVGGDGWATWNVTNAVSSAYSGSQDAVSLYGNLSDYSGNDRMYMYSKEYMINTGLRPYLKITYTPPGTAPTNITLTLSEGHHNITIYANDTLGNMGNSSFISFDVLLSDPSINVTLGESISKIQWIVPFYTGTTANDVEPTNQTSGVGLFRFTNNGTGTINLSIRFNDTYANVATECAQNNGYTDSIVISTSWQAINDSLDEEDMVRVWCRRDYSAVPAKKPIKWEFNATTPAT